MPSINNYNNYYLSPQGTPIKINVQLTCKHINVYTRVGDHFNSTIHSVAKTINVK